MKSKTLLLAFMALGAMTASARDGWRPAGAIAWSEQSGVEPVMVRVLESSASRQELEYDMPGARAVKGGLGEFDVICQKIVMGNAPVIGEPGKPILPKVPCSIVIPPDTVVDRVEVALGDRVRVDGEYMIEHGQKPFPLLPDQEPEYTERDPSVYGSNEVFPSERYELAGVQSRRGVDILTVVLNPVEYLPASGQVWRYESMTVTVFTRPVERTRNTSTTIRRRPDRSDRTRAIVDNPEVLDGYERELETRSGNDDSSRGPAPLWPVLPCDPAFSNQYVIITSEAIRDASNVTVTVSDLAAHKIARGYTAEIVTMEDILATPEYSDGTIGYTNVMDDGVRLRNFIIDAYNNWETDFVLLGGDTGIIPLRELWSTSWVSGETRIPSDLYYQCLDGSFNADGDDVWGERYDGGNWSNVDLYAEVYIGRASVENEEEMANFVYKVITFENSASATKGRALMLGEHLGFGGVSEYAKASMEEIRLGSSEHGYTTEGFASSDSYVVDTLYDADGTWSKTRLLGEINANKYGIINHLGHCNVGYCARLVNADADGLRNVDHIFMYSQGCLPGAFDSDCIAEHLIGSNTNGMYSVVMNSRYGWGMGNSTDGPSQRFNRPFWHAYFGENLETLGEFNAYSHEYNVWIVADSYIRWCMYESNLLGDPAASFDPPWLSPSEDYYCYGLPGEKPYEPVSKTYGLTFGKQDGPNSDWFVSNSVDWVEISPTNFTLSPLQSTSVVISVIQNMATNLPEGTHTGAVFFVNMSSGEGNVFRDVILRIEDNYRVRVEPFNWVDPEGHTDMTLDSAYGVPYRLPFTVSFYGSNYNVFCASQRGYLTLGNNGTDARVNVDMPNSGGPNSVVCPYWDNLTSTRSPGKVYGGVETIGGTQTMAITWENVGHRETVGNRLTFQVLIPEQAGSNDNDLVFQYLSVDEDNEETGSGRSATIGMEDEAGSHFAKYSYDGQKLLGNEQAIRFKRVRPVDTTAPSGAVYVADIGASNVDFNVVFDEFVMDFDAGDLALTATAPGATLGEISGDGRNYKVEINGITGGGQVTVGVPAGGVFDYFDNLSVEIPPATCVVPQRQVNLSDDMELDDSAWTPSSGRVGGYSYDGWEWGVPSYASGPSNTYSGTMCLGTVIAGCYSNLMNCSMQSRLVDVGPDPVLEFAVWYDLESPPASPNASAIGDLGYVEVNAGQGWINVTPGDGFTGSSDGWVRHAITLDESKFANKSLRVRFRMMSDLDITYAGMYIDDVRVTSGSDDGVWVASYTPDTAAPGGLQPVEFTAYNSSDDTYYGVVGKLSSPDAGVGFSGGRNVVYGNIGPGETVTGAAPITLDLGAADEFASSRVTLFHSVTASVGYVCEEMLDFGISGLSVTSGASRITARSGAGVVDWLARPLRGDGSPGSSLFQVLFAGSNGVPDAAADCGGADGDDELLLARDGGRPYDRIGTGDGVRRHAGMFDADFLHSLPSNSTVYVRAWDGPGFDTSVAYGDSGTFSLSGGWDTNDFGRWVVDVPVYTNRDWNGDSIPDGWCVRHGMDPRDPVAPLAPTENMVTEFGAWGSESNQLWFPGRLALWSNLVYIADTRNNRIQVWDRLLGENLYSYGSYGTGPGELNWPQGLDVDALSNRLVVADTGNNRVQIWGINPTNGSLTYVTNFGALGAADGQFKDPYDVAVDPASSSIAVADSLNYRIQVFNPDGSFSHKFGAKGTGAGQFMRPKGICAAASGALYVADTDNHRIQEFTPAGAYVSEFGGFGTGHGRFIQPTGVGVGTAGRVYVADSANDRIQVFNAVGTHIISAGGPGRLNRPQGVAAVAGELTVLVADTWNHRIVAYTLTNDADGDGMDDTWEDLNGLDSTVDDARLDADGDGLLNIGEYRLNLNPRVADSDGDGTDDGDLVGARSFNLTGVRVRPDGGRDGRRGLDPLGFRGLEIRWSATAGTVYEIQACEDLASHGDWNVLGVVTASVDGVETWIDELDEGAARRFYRVSVTPLE